MIMADILIDLFLGSIVIYLYFHFILIIISHANFKCY